MDRITTKPSNTDEVAREAARFFYGRTGEELDGRL